MLQYGQHKEGKLVVRVWCPRYYGNVMAIKDVATLQKKDMVMMFESRCSSNGTVLLNMEKTVTQGFKGVCHKV
jgi:hypothetical protein